MKIDLKRQEERLTVSLSGRLDTVTAPEFGKVMETELESVTDLTLDLAQLEYVTSAGLRIFCAAAKKMAAKNGVLATIHANKEVKDIFQMTGMTKLLCVR